MRCGNKSWLRLCHCYEYTMEPLANVMRAAQEFHPKLFALLRNPCSASRMTSAAVPPRSSILNHLLCGYRVGILGRNTPITVILSAHSAPKLSS